MTPIIQHPGIKAEIAIPAIPDDERVWVPQAPCLLYTSDAADE